MPRFCFFLVPLLLNFSLSFSAFAQEENSPAPEETVQTTETTENKVPEQQPTEEGSANSKSDSQTNTKAAAKPVIKPPADLFQQSQKDSKHYLRETESLLIGTEEFVTLFKPSTNVNNKGVFIFIPDWQQSIINPKNIAPLQQNLPAQGWATLTIQPLKKPQNYPSAAQKKIEQETENSEALSAHKQQLATIIEALLNKVSQQPGNFILVSEGHHGGLIINTLAETEIPQPSAVVLLSAYVTSETENKLVAKNLAESPLPILDLLLTKDNPAVIRSAKARKNEADKMLKIMYRQQQLINFTPGYYPPESLLKAIQGWLNVNGW